MKAKQAIEEANEAIKGFEKTIESIDVASLEENKKAKEEELQERIWEIKKDYDRDDIFKDFISGHVGSKRNLLDYLLSQELLKYANINDEFEELRKSTTTLMAEDSKPQAPISPLDCSGLKSIEEDSIWQESITGSENSYLTELVRKLNHHDWVSQGITKYIDNAETCPFCNQSLDNDTKEKIKAYIDEEYKNKIKAIQDEKDKYSRATSGIINSLDNLENTLPKYDDKIDNLRKTIQANCAEMVTKEKTPSEVISIESTASLFKAINEQIDKKNQEIRNLNEQLDHRKKFIKNNKQQFWQLLRAKYDSDIAAYQEGNRIYQ